jgi:hypothetical protein
VTTLFAEVKWPIHANTGVFLEEILYHMAKKETFADEVTLDGRWSLCGISKMLMEEK